MMVGSYPCCGGHLMIELPSKTPSLAPDECEHCGAPVWHLFSRLAPQTWTEQRFLELFDVDKETKVVTPKDPRWDPYAE